MSKRGLFAVLGLLVAAIVIVLAYIAWLSFGTNSRTPDTVDLSPITIIEPPQPIADFTLTTQNGESLSLSDLQDKPILLNFGYTHCPDVCPITLGQMRNIHEDLGNENLQYIFITVDGQRDTPEVLADYMATLRVDSFMIALTGTEEAVRSMGVPFGLDFIYNEADALGNYTVEHTAGLFLLNSEGEWIRRYAYGMKTEDIVADLREHLQ